MFNSLAESFNTYLVIIIHGALILLSFLFSCNVFRVNKKANIFFGVFLLIWSTYWAEEICVLINIGTVGGFYELILRFIQFLTPIFFYYGTVYFANPNYKFERSQLTYLAAPTVYLIGLIIVNNEPNSNLQLILTATIIIHALFYIYKSYSTIQHHKKRLIQFSSLIEEKDLKWIEQIILTLLALLLFIGAYNVFFTTQYLNIFANLFSCTIVFFVGYNGVRQKEIFVINIDQLEDSTSSDEGKQYEKRKPLTIDELLTLKKKLLDLMAKDQPFLSPDLNLLELAKMIEITPHQLSYLINEGFKENFFSFINKYRIEKVKSNLLDFENNHFSIMGIAYESGFNSKTAFYNTFKKITKMTPSEFIKKGSRL